MIENPCDFFKDIEANPLGIYPMTAREELQLSFHIRECKDCWNITTRIINKYPEERKDIGFNIN